MKKKIRLINCWENRDEVIRRCEERRACYTEFTKLKRAKAEVAFRRVLLRNFRWVVNHNILDHDISYVFFCGSFGDTNYTAARIILHRPYKDTKHWWIDDRGYLIEPYTL